MIDDDTYCIDVITQIGSVAGALQSVALGLVGHHLRHCVLDAVRDGADPTERVAEATGAVERLLRT